MLSVFQTSSVYCLFKFSLYYFIYVFFNRQITLIIVLCITNWLIREWKVTMPNWLEFLATERDPPDPPSMPDTCDCSLFWRCRRLFSSRTHRGLGPQSWSRRPRRRSSAVLRRRGLLSEQPEESCRRCRLLYHYKQDFTANWFSHGR